ncbi:MAG: VCBS repeat-containing protein [Myxococcales bacterium]|nr:VCBS repeat-containing protein [Myxococcales bacterium]
MHPKMPPQIVLIPLAVALLTACGSGDEGKVAPPIPSIKVAVTSPTDLANTTGKVQFKGTLTPSDAAVADLKVELRVKGKIVGTGTGAAFSVEVDTTQKDAKGKPVFKDGKVCVSFAASGTLGATGSGSSCVTSDNSDPVVTVTTPELDSVHIGSVSVTGSIGEKYLADASITVDGTQVVGFCNEKQVDSKGKPVCNFADCVKKYGSCLKGQGGFNLTIDRSSEATKDVKIVVKATDLTKHETELEVPVRVLRPPSWDTARSFNDKKLGVIWDVVLYDFNSDGVLDTLLATDKGIWLRPGVNIGDGDKGKGNAALGPAEKIGDALLKTLVLTDIDGDGLKDVFGAGLVSIGEYDPVSGVVAMLTKAGGIRVVEQRELDGSATVAATGDMDLNGVTDLVVGSKEDEFAVQIISSLAPDDVVCPSADKPKRKCSTIKDVKDLGTATIFGEVAVHPAKGDVTSLVIADFHVGAKEVYLDVAVGRGTSSNLSIFENKSGQLLAPVDAPKAGFVADMNDVALMVPTDWNQDGKIDLIIASKGSGVVRWISGLGNGKFGYKPKVNREIWLNDVTAIEVGPVGPAGKDYVMVSHGGRTLTFVPLLPGDRAHIDKCFRSWVLGTSIAKVRHGDMDNDGNVDLVAIDRAPHGIVITRSTGDGNYHAATAHRVCGLQSGSFFFSHLKVAHFKLDDVTADGKPDLMLISNSATSQITAKAKTCMTKTKPQKPIPRATHFLHLYINDGSTLEEGARAGEWGPYNSGGTRQAHGIKITPESTCGTVLPDINALEFGEFNGTGAKDMVIARDQNYTVGQPPDGDTKCAFKEQNEVANLYGVTEGGTEESPGPDCKNFRDNDEDQKTPLFSTSGGAPLLRASVVMFRNPDPSKPFGMGADNRPDNPSQVKPMWMFSGGKQPISLVVGQFDNDAIDDVATVMNAVGDRSAPNYLAPRVRVFKGHQSGKMYPVQYFTQGTKQGDEYANENPATEKVPIGVKEQDTWMMLSPHTENEVPVPVSYLVTEKEPKLMRGGRFCKDGETSLYTLNGGGTFSVFRAQGNLVMAQAKHLSAGTELQGFGVTDADGDKCTDLLYAKKDQLGIAKGTSQGFLANEYFLPITFGNLTAVEVFDVNDDGALDMVLVDGGTSSVYFYLNDGDGSFLEHKEALPMLAGSTGLQRGDINGDGCSDIAVQGTYGVAVALSTACKKK